MKLEVNLHGRSNHRLFLGIQTTKLQTFLSCIIVFDIEKFTSRKTEEKMNDKEAINQLKELAKITKAKD